MVELLGEAHPELRQEEARVAELLEAEEERFSRTLETAPSCSTTCSPARATRSPPTTRSGSTTPTASRSSSRVEIAGEHGKRVDEAGFAELMDEQRDRARAHRRAGRVEVSELESDFQTEFVATSGST